MKGYLKRRDLSLISKYKRLEEGQRIWIRTYSKDRAGDIQELFEHNQEEKLREREIDIKIDEVLGK